MASTLLALPLFTFGQFSYVHDQRIEVQDENGNPLPLAWSGGLNSAQFNTMDVNGDNINDLINSTEWQTRCLRLSHPMELINTLPNTKRCSG